MCVARGNSKIRPSYLQARAGSRANHLAQRLDVASSRLDEKPRRRRVARAEASGFGGKSRSSASGASAKCSVSQSQSQEKHPCLPHHHRRRLHQHTHGHTQELRNAKDAADVCGGQRRVSGRRDAVVGCAGALLTYSVLVFPSGGTRWPPFSKPTAFSVKTIQCACATGSVARAACTSRTSRWRWKRRHSSSVTVALRFIPVVCRVVSCVNKTTAKVDVSLMCPYYKRQYVTQHVIVTPLISPKVFDTNL